LVISVLLCRYDTRLMMTPMRARTHCRSGHRLAGANVAVRADGSQRCRACGRRWARDGMRRRRARRAARREHKPSRAYIPPRPPKPPRPGEAAVVLCQTGPVDSAGHNGNRYTRFATVADAIAFAQTVPCPSPDCRGCHVAAWRRGGAFGAAVFDAAARAVSRSDELAECYPRRQALPPVEHWPAPREFNEHLQPKGAVQ
jgi:hypothetical protein